MTHDPAIISAIQSGIIVLACIAGPFIAIAASSWRQRRRSS